MKKLITFVSVVTSFSAQASICRGVTSFQEAKTISCEVTNMSGSLSERVITKSMLDSEAGTAANLFAVGNYTVSANSHSINECNEGDFLTITDKKTGSSFSTKNGEISFRSADGKISYNLNCTFSR
jgi:hypothetical protein